MLKWILFKYLYATKAIKMQSKIINSLKILKFFINNDILDQKFF